MTTNNLYPDLPEFDPHPDLWARIEADLTSDERLNRAIGDLPQMEPKADLWDRIEANNQPATGRVVQHPAQETARRSPFTVVRPLWAGLAAAAVVVLIGTWLFLNPAAQADERIEYAVEPNATWPTNAPNLAETDADQRAADFIARQCAEQTFACQRPEVHELRNRLENLNDELTRLEEERQTFGDDPRLIRAQVQVENQQAEVTKELIMLLRS